MTSRLTKPGPLGHPSTLKQRPKQCVGKTGDPWVFLNYQDPPFQYTGCCPRQTGRLGVSRMPIEQTHNVPAQGAHVTPPHHGEVPNIELVKLKEIHVNALEATVLAQSL